MERKVLRKLIKRLAVGRIARGEEASARRRILDDLYSAGIPTEGAASLSQDELETMPGHTLLAWGRDEEGCIYLYAIPNAEIAAPMRNALDAIDDLHFEGPFDCSLYQYAAAIRVLAAIGLEGRDGDELYEKRIPPVYDEMPGERDLEYLPGSEELQALHGSWRSYRVGLNEIPPGGLDRRFTHVIAVRQTG